MSDWPVGSHKEIHAAYLLIQENQWDQDHAGLVNPYRIAREDQEELEYARNLKFPVIEVQE